MFHKRTAYVTVWSLLLGCLAVAAGALTLPAPPLVTAPSRRQLEHAGAATDSRATRGDPVRTTFTVAAAGDIACEPDAADYNLGAGRGDHCRQQATSDLLVGRRLDAVLALGDLQYDSGELAGFQRVYDPSWGRVKSITRPVPGNHEYKTPGAAGYYDYFGWRAGPRGKGFYSFDLGTWHLVALNSECYFRAQCAQEQERWLRADLAAHAGPCQLAYWHRPRFTSGHHGATQVSWTDRVWTMVRQVAHGHRPRLPKNEALTMDPLWKIMSENKVEVVLNGHDHDYERFAPMNANGQPDPNGVREFVVGTGGKEFRGFTTRLRTSEMRGGTPGVLLLTLKPNGYTWRMQPIAGRIAIDGGSGRCH